MQASRRPHLAVWLAVLAVGFALGMWFDHTAWSVRWRIFSSGGFTYRVDQRSGHVTLLDPNRGWVEIPDPPPPFKPAAPDSAALVTGQAPPRP